MDSLLLYKIIFLSSALGSLIIALVVSFKNIKTRLNLFFVLINLSAVIWAVGRYALLVVQDINLAFIWVKILYIGSILVYLFLLYVILIFLDLVKKRKIILIIFSLNSLLVLILNLIDLFFGTNFLIKDITHKLIFTFFETPNTFYYLHLVNYLFIPQYVFIEMIIALKNTYGIKKSQLKYLLFSSLLGFLGGGSLIPLIYGINMYPVTIILTPFYFITMAYAIMRYRLMNIRLVITRSILYGLLVASVAAFFALSIVWTGNLIGGNTQASKMIIYIVDAFLVVIFLDPLKRILAKLTDKVFYKGKIDYQVLLQEAGNIVAREIDLDKLLKKAVELLADKLKIHKISVFTPTNKHFKLIANSENNSKNLKISEHFTDYLTDHHDFVIVEELMRNLDNFKSDSLEYKVLDKFIKEAESLGIEMVIPVIEKNKLTAIFLFSAKQSGDLYGQDDINFFKVLTPQIATAIEKAKLYEEVQELNISLKAQVEERTQSLQEANVALEDRNKFLTTMQVVTNMVS